MTKYYCDCCDKETKSLYRFEYLIHLEDKNPGYIDSEFNPISGRFVQKEVCISCYNDIMQTAVDKLFEIKKEYRRI